MGIVFASSDGIIRLTRRELLRGVSAAMLLSAPSSRSALAQNLGGPDKLPSGLMPIRVEGPHLVANGSRIAFRGVSIGDPRLSRSGRDSTSDMRVLASEWGFDTVRISVHPGTWRREPLATLLALDRQVEAARCAGMRSIVDWHAIGWPGAGRFEPPAGWGLASDVYDTDIRLARHFWSVIAARYGSRADVVFELWNEPVRLDRPQPSVPGVDWEGLRPFYRQLLDDIRQEADNLVLVAGGSWAADLTGIRDDPLDDERVAYSWHVYPGTSGGDTRRLSEFLDGLDMLHPVVVTEWGFGGSDPHLSGGPESFGERFLNDMILARQFGWVAWCWHPEWEPSLIEADWSTPTRYGQWIKDVIGRT